MRQAERVIMAAIAAGGLMLALPAAAQETVIIDGSGVHNQGSVQSFDLGARAGGIAEGRPGRATMPFNKPGGALYATQDTSRPPLSYRGSTRVNRTAARPEPSRAPARQTATPRPQPKPQPQPQTQQAAVSRPAPAPKPVTEAPAKVTRPAREVTPPTPQPTPVPKPTTAAVTRPTPTPAPAPRPAPAAQPAPKPEPKPEPKPAATEQPTRVAAITPQAANPDLTRILFQAGEEKVPASGIDILKRIADEVRENRDIRLQVKSYAQSDTETADNSRRVSLRRAGNVRRVLLDNGIESFRILVRALGTPGPDDAGPGNRVDIVVGRR